MTRQAQLQDHKQLIARVLRRELREADAVNALSEERGIFHVAESFADELASAAPGFDRVRFIEDATDGTS